MAIQPGRLSPLTQISFDNSQAGANSVSKPTILIGQCLTPQPLALVPAFSKSQVQSVVGRGSTLDRMFQFYFALDSQGPIYILPMADATGSTAATGTITLLGTATAAGSLAVYVAGQLVSVAVNAGDAATVVTANLVAAINAALDLPVTAIGGNATDGTPRKSTLTSRHAGTCGNNIDLRINYQGARSGETVPAGLGVTIVGMSGGATDPSLATAFALIGDAPGRFFVHPYTSTTALQAGAAALSFTGGRWSSTRKTWGHIFTARSDTPTNLVSFAATDGNDPHHSIFAFETTSPTPEWEAAAIWAGAMAISLRAQPNQPVQTLPLNGFLPPQQQPDSAGGPFSATTRETMLQNGLGVARYDRGAPQIVRAVTTYTTNALGVPDQSYQDTEDMFWCMAFADFIDTAENQVFARALLAQDGVKAAPGIPIVTPRGFLAFMVAVYNQMQFVGLVDDVGDFIAASSAVADQVAAGQLDVLWAPYMVVGLRQIANTVQFRKLAGAVASFAQ